MKSKLLAFALCMTALSSANIEAKIAAKNAKPFQISKEKSAITFFGAEDTSEIDLVGPTSAFTQLTFTQDQFSFGKGITPNLASSEFLLEKGTYYISFTGTFQLSGSSATAAYYDIALQLGPNFIFVNTDSVNFTVDNPFSVSSLYKVIEVKKPTNLSIVARCTSTGDTVLLTTRSISIEKFS